MRGQIKREKGSLLVDVRALMCVAQKLYCLNSTPNSGPCGMLSPGSSQVKWLWYIPTVENFDLTPAHTCAPISHAWLKNVSCCRLAWHNFQKYVNSDPCKERKPCVKWINDNTFLAISDFVDKRFLDNFAFGRLRTSSEDIGLLRESSEMIVSFSKIPALPG